MGNRGAGPAGPWEGTLVACLLTPMPAAVAGRLCAGFPWRRCAVHWLRRTSVTLLERRTNWSNSPFKGVRSRSSPFSASSPSTRPRPQRTRAAAVVAAGVAASCRFPHQRPQQARRAAAGGCARQWCAARGGPVVASVAIHRRVCASPRTRIAPALSTTPSRPSSNQMEGGTGWSRSWAGPVDRHTRASGLCRLRCISASQTRTAGPRRQPRQHVR